MEVHGPNHVFCDIRCFRHVDYTRSNLDPWTTGQGWIVYNRHVENSECHKKRDIIQQHVDQGHHRSSKVLEK